MRPYLKLETLEEIGLIEIDAPTDTQLAGVNVPESQNANTFELPTKKRKGRGTYSNV
jgi:hypothetical protein